MVRKRHHEYINQAEQDVESMSCIEQQAKQKNGSITEEELGDVSDSYQGNNRNTSITASDTLDLNS